MLLEISNAEYRAMEGIASTEIKKMSKSMAHYKWYKDHPEDSDNPSLLFGRAYHKMILEPSDFDNEFIVAPKVDKRTKEGKEAWANFLKEAEGKDVIDEEMYQTICDMRTTLYATPYARKLLYGEHEKSIFWDDDASGLRCKCRPDSFGTIGNQNVCVDLKTCQDAETQAFMRDAIKFGYDIQASHYCQGLEAEYKKPYLFVFVAQEKKPPYAVNILQADEFFMNSGRELRADLLELYKECLKKDEYPSYMGFNNQAEINSLSLPSWLKKAYEPTESEE